MALLRKDLKLGFLAGGTILVLGVGYVLVSSFFGPAEEPVNDPLAFDADSALSQPDDDSSPGQAGSADPPAFGADTAADWEDFGEPSITRTPTPTELASGTLPPDAPVEPVTPNINDDEADAVDAMAGGGVVDSIVAGTSEPSVVSADAAPAPAGTPAPSDTGARRTHEVASGENLSSIAEKYYGDPNLFPIIQNANPSVDSRYLRVGQILQIPDRAAAELEKASAAKAPAQEPDSTEEGIHVVRSGETLSSIANKRLGRAALWQDIYDLNLDVIGSDPANLKVGMKLKLPK